MVAVAPGAGLQRGGVGAGLGLGQGEAADPFAAGEPGQEALLLFRRPEFHDGAAGDRIMHADDGRAGAVARRDFLQHAGIGDRANVEAAKFLRRGHAQKTKFAHRLEFIGGEAMLAVAIGRSRRQLVAGETPRHVPDFALRLVQQHGASLTA